MAAQTFNIDFDGYWREENKSGVPNKSGIYCVYTCVFNSTKKTVSIQKLIYIGESADVGDRISNHEHQKDWEGHLNKGEVLCYSFGGISEIHRERCEAAMIFKHQPSVNTEYKNSFPFDQTMLELTGETVKLAKSFTVLRS